MATAPRDEALLSAISVMTAWAADPEGDFAQGVLQRIYDEEGLNGIDKLAAGLITLSGHLLVRLEQLQPGTPISQVLQELALRKFRRDEGA